MRILYKEPGKTPTTMVIPQKLDVMQQHEPPEENRGASKERRSDQHDIQDEPERVQIRSLQT